MTVNDGWNCEIDRRTQTECRSIQYDCLSQTGSIVKEDGCCVDMTGAIRLFLSFAPEILMIKTFQLGKPDTSYRRLDENIWQPMSPEGGRWKGWQPVRVNEFESTITFPKPDRPDGSKRVT